MRISFVIQDLFAQGAQYATALLVRGFIAKGYAVDLVVSKVHTDLLEQGEQTPFDVPERTHWVYLNDRKARNNIHQLRHYLATADSVAVVSMTSTYTDALAIARIGLARCPRLYTVEHGATFGFYDDGTKKPSLRILSLSWIKQRLINWAFDGYFAVSTGVAKEMPRVYGMRPEKISVVYNPVVDDGFIKRLKLSPKHPWLLDKKCPTFVAAGAYQPYKQHMVMLKAMAQVVRQLNVRLIIFGRGPLEAEYLEFIHTHHLEDNVSIAGFTNCLPAEVAASDGFICSTNIESFGIAIVEALAAGVPVVSTDAPCGPREILADGKYGKLVRVGDVEAMSVAIIEMAKKGRHAEPEVSWNRFTVEAIVALYEKAMGLVPGGVA